MTPVTGLYEVLTREGARVVSPEQAVADPFATRQLADLGVKTECPGALGLARTRGSLALGLIAQAGVFLQNLVPDAAGRLGCAGGEVPAAAGGAVVRTGQASTLARWPIFNQRAR